MNLPATALTRVPFRHDGPIRLIQTILKLISPLTLWCNFSSPPPSWAEGNVAAESFRQAKTPIPEYSLLAWRLETAARGLVAPEMRLLLR